MSKKATAGQLAPPNAIQDLVRVVRGQRVMLDSDLAETVELHDEQIKAIAHVLNQMMQQPEKPTRQIGVHVPAKEVQP